MNLHLVAFHSHGMLQALYLGGEAQQMALLAGGSLMLVPIAVSC